MANPDSGPTAGAGDPCDPRNLTPFIREMAQKYGINPDIAVKVAKSEGLGSFKCQVPGEHSYTAFQLYCGGGLGNLFHQQTGLDVSDPKNERAAIDFALKYASENGWGAWHGAAHAGIGNWDGIDRSHAPADLSRDKWDSSAPGVCPPDTPIEGRAHTRGTGPAAAGPYAHHFRHPHPHRHHRHHSLWSIFHHNNHRHPNPTPAGKVERRHHMVP